MPNDILVLCGGFLFFVGFVVGIVSGLGIAKGYPRRVFTCPHGHPDWDSCPVCCH